MKRKKTTFIILISIGILIGIGVGKLADILFDDKFSYFSTKGLMHVFFREEIRFNGLLFKIPSTYFREKKEDSIVLIKHSKPKKIKEIIIIEKDKYFPKEKFFKYYKNSLTKLKYININERNVLIDGNECYFIKGFMSNDLSDCSAYLSIPQRKTLITYIGQKEDINNFQSIVNRIKFIKI